MFGGKKTGKSATQADPHKWDDLSSSERRNQPSLPNRLQKSLDWWGKSEHFKSGAGYRETDPKVYRFAAKTLDAAGYSFLQITRNADNKSVSGQYGGLVDESSKKRSFAIEPLFTQQGVGGHEQKRHRAESLSFKGTTFPDLVVQKRDQKPVAVELKVPKTYGSASPGQALKDLVQNGEVGSDPFFQREFSGRKRIMGDAYEQRLLVDLNTSGLSKKDALAYFKKEAQENGDKFAFDTLQFIHRKGGQVHLSSAYNAADGFASKNKEPTLNVNKAQTPFSSFFAPPSATTSTSSSHPPQPGTSAPPRDTPPVLSPMHQASQSSNAPQVDLDGPEKKRKRADSVSSHDSSPPSSPRTPPPQPHSFSSPSTAPTPLVASPLFPPLAVPSPTPQQLPSTATERRPTKQAKVEAPQPPAKKLDRRTNAGKLQAAAEGLKGKVKPISSFFGNK